MNLMSGLEATTNALYIVGGVLCGACGMVVDKSPRF
jgi:hypothetical protein